MSVSERTVTNLLDRYEELVALRLTDRTHLPEVLKRQGRAVLALDGLQPDVGHEVLWVVRECLSGEILLARSLLSATEESLVGLLGEVAEGLEVPVVGVVSDGQHQIRRAVGRVFPQAPHQLCQFHYLREAAKEVYEAYRHAKKELKKRVRGVRPIERELEGRQARQAEAVRGYCLAVRSAITDDGRPPLSASGIKLHERIEAIHASIERVGKRGSFPQSRAFAQDARARPRPDGPPVGAHWPMLLVGTSSGAHPEKRRGPARRGATSKLQAVAFGDGQPQRGGRRVAGSGLAVFEGDQR